MLDFCCFINIMIESNWEEERLYFTERQQFIIIYGIKGGSARQEPEGRNCGRDMEGFYCLTCFSQFIQLPFFYNPGSHA